MLMPQPGSLESFMSMLGGILPPNFADIPQLDRARLEKGNRYAAQRGLLRDELSGLFKSIGRDYMAGLKALTDEIRSVSRRRGKRSEMKTGGIRPASNQEQCLNWLQESWGTWIRTKIDWARASCSAVELSPKRCCSAGGILSCPSHHFKAGLGDLMVPVQRNQTI
jgi:hypothetical protein